MTQENVFSRAEWIFAGAAEAPVVNRYFVYRETFSAAGAGEAKLYISAHSQYAVYLNGVFVNAGQYEDYEFHPVYDELPVSAFLRQGSNQLEVFQYVCGEDFSTRCKGVPGVIFALFEVGEGLLFSAAGCPSGEDRRFLPGTEKITNQLGFTAEYDARGPEPVWAGAVRVEKEKKLFPRPVKKLTVGKALRAVRRAQGVFWENDPALPKAQRMQTAFLSAREDVFQEAGEDTQWDLPADCRADGVYWIGDLGNECAGWLTLSADVAEGTEILIGFGEHLDDLRVRAAVGGRNFCMRYIAKAGHNEFFYPFQRVGLRYLEIHIYARQGRICRFGLVPTDYPLTPRPAPVSDRLHRMIYETGCRTLAKCMHEHYEDCPWREQALYAMDSRVQMLCGYYAFGELDMPRASLLLMARSLRERDGLLELCAPGRVRVNIPSFTAVFTRAALEYAQHSGDQAFTAEILPTVLQIARGFAQRMDENGLIPLYRGQEYWNFYEWREGLDGRERHAEKVFEAPLNAFVSDQFRCCAQLCQMAGESAGAARFYACHQAMNAALHARFFDPARRAYVTRLGDASPRHALTQALMLFSGAVPAENRAEVERVLRQGDLIPCSLSMTIYLYDALLKNPDPENRAFVLADIHRLWGGMIRAGADTFWETERGADDFARAGSLCHGWSAVPVYIFGRYFAGDA